MTTPVHTQILPLTFVSTSGRAKVTMFHLEKPYAMRGRQDPGFMALGARDPTKSIAYKMPVAVGSPAFRLVVGGFEYIQLGKLMLSVKVAAYGSGVLGRVVELQSDTWTGWGDAP